MIKKKNIGTQCCEIMQYHVALSTDKLVYDVDTIIRFNKKTGDYGIPIHDGGSSYIKIKFCPWCGKKLNK